MDLAMANRAVSNLLDRLDPGPLGEAQSFEPLIGRRFPVEVKYLCWRTQRIFGMPVAFQAPPHLQGLLFPGDRHLVDWTMTARTADSFLDMDTVIEINVIGQLMDSRPADRPIGR